MITKIYNILSAGLMCCGFAAAFTACTDTWDDHYESLGNGVVHDGTLWQAIKSDPNLSNFAKVVEGCDFAKSLDGSQVFTVFAPTNENFSSQEADQLISDYKTQEAANVTEEDNTVLKEFIQNHVALYNYSVSNASRDSIMLMNGKYAVLAANDISGVQLQSKNQLYGNGVLFTVKEKLGFKSNVFEYLRIDPDLDSLRSFMYNSHYYYKEFVPERSIAGSIVNGKTQYLDSVFTQRNELFTLLRSQLNDEDSTYYMVAPTNNVWKELIEEYEPYFNYPEGIEDRDSLIYTNSRLAIIKGTTFSATFNTDKTLPDSAMSENCVKNYASRVSSWGLPFEYYEYRYPLNAPYGVLSQSKEDIVDCSNGWVHKAFQWNINKLMSFNQWIILQAEEPRSIKEISKVADSHGDSINTVTGITRNVTSDNRGYYGKVWNNAFIEFQPDVATMNHTVTFYLRNVLSNMGYDIYLVTAPALANDTNATEAQRLPTIMQCTINVPGKKSEKLVNPNDPEGGQNFISTPDVVDYILLAEDYKFDYCTVDVEDETMQTTLSVETKVSNAQLRNNNYTRTMRIDCILVVPHGTLQLVDELPAGVPDSYQGKPGVLLFPHGYYEDRPFKYWYMLR